MTSYIPDRGHIIWLISTPQAGHEQAGRRPALVLSPASYNGRVSLATVCPITNQQKGYPFEVIIPERLPVTGVILSDQVKSLDWRAHRAEYICALPDGTVNEVLRKVTALLGPLS